MKYFLKIGIPIKSAFKSYEKKRQLNNFITKPFISYKSIFLYLILKIKNFINESH